MTGFLLSALFFFQFALADYRPHSHCGNESNPEVHSHEHEAETTSHLHPETQAAQLESHSQPEQSKDSDECHDCACYKLQIAFLKLQNYEYFISPQTNQNSLQSQRLQVPLLEGPFQPPKS